MGYSLAKSDEVLSRLSEMEKELRQVADRSEYAALVARQAADDLGSILAIVRGLLTKPPGQL